MVKKEKMTQMEAFRKAVEKLGWDVKNSEYEKYAREELGVALKNVSVAKSMEKKRLAGHRRSKSSRVDVNGAVTLPTPVVIFKSSDTAPLTVDELMAIKNASQLNELVQLAGGSIERLAKCLNALVLFSGK